MQKYSLADFYYALIFLPGILCFQEVWVVGGMVLILNLLLYFFQPAMLVFREKVKNFELFFWGMNLIIVIGISVVNLAEESRVWVVMILAIVIMLTTGIWKDMKRIIKEQSK